MRNDYITESICRVGAHILIIGKNRINVVTIICCNRNRLSFTIFHNRSLWLDTTASSGRSCNFITVTGKYWLQRVIVGNTLKNIRQRIRPYGIAIHTNGGEGISGSRFKDKSIIRTAQNGGGHIGGDDSARTRHRSQDELFTHKCRTDGMWFRYTLEKVGCHCTDINSIHKNTFNLIAIIWNNGDFEGIPAEDQCVAGRGYSTTVTRCQMNTIFLFGKECPNCLVRQITRYCPLRHRTHIHAIHPYRINNVTIVGEVECNRFATCKHGSIGIQFCSAICIGNRHLIVGQTLVIDLKQLVIIHVRNCIESRIRH